jgi:hypothetical protein
MFAALNAKLKGWRTVILNAVVGIPSGLLLFGMQFQDSGVDFTPVLKRYFTPEDILAITTVVSILGVILRFITTTPIGKKNT